MRIKLKYPDVETFIQKYAVNISRGGIFIATKTPKPVGTALRFEFLLANSDAGQSIIRGEGQVQWTREFDPQQPNKAHGMGVRFLRLDEESQAIVDRALAWRAQQAAPRVASDAPSAPVVSEGSRPVSITPPPTPPADTRASDTRANDTRANDTRTDDPRAEDTRPDDARPMMQQPSPNDAVTSTHPLPEGRSPGELTRPIAIPDAPTPDSMPIPVGRPKDVETKPISLGAPRRENGSSSHDTHADLDAMAAEWGLSPDRLSRVLRRRRPRMVEATAELERLLRKPPRPPVPSKTEALSLLHDLLERKPAQAAGGEPDPPANGKRNR
jgi:uncharacterized protein (TIGR02266 family)